MEDILVQEVTNIVATSSLTDVFSNVSTWLSAQLGSLSLTEVLLLLNLFQ